ncbi:serine hydrolase domain-containing protein [Paenibacillus ginsengarvi]|uniref:Class A beta-lactamase-related serine hydrolase n=1 Tax=Paenibacillus ginsengarvi TaxID=400777 RepID=A0A3B0C7E1_9BACL|nr:serine hydrolase domain-containing protein [Paenibacillus ginsengarvi]RKN80571.1 class A beta-lactamase-related serine hydrolase [Paenibacillus ginsengarvi]
MPVDIFNSLDQYTEQIKNRIAASAAAVCVIKDNEIIHEWYSGNHHFHSGARKVDASSQFNVYSTRVTYVGLAAAIAINDGAIQNLDDPISKYLSIYNNDILGNTTLRHLVTRTTGLQFQGNGGVVRKFEEGTSFEGKKPEILATIIKNATGKTVAEIINERVLKPLGLTRTEWRTEGKETLVCDINDPNSYPTLRLESNEGSDRNLYITARELALWGNLHLNKGAIKGKQILPKEIFQSVSSIMTPNTLPVHLPRLGYFWWIQDKNVSNSEIGPDLPEGTYQIFGASGCSCTVIPNHKAVVVRMTNSLWTFGGKNGFDYIADIQRFGNLVEQALNEYSIVHR